MAYSTVPTVSTSDSWTASQHNTYLKDNMAALKALIDALPLTMFPVGSLYFTKTNVNPGTFLGGTWIAYGSGRVLVGYDSGQTEFDTAGETGGSKTHALTSAENGTHAHSIATMPTSYDYVGVAGSGYLGAAVVGTATSNNSGSGTPHNNLQPYIVGFMWERTV